MLKINLIYLLPKTKNIFFDMINCDKCKNNCKHINNYLKEKHSIEIVKDNPDINIAFYEGGPNNEQTNKLLKLLKENKTPIIICERIDASSSHLLSTHDKAHNINILHPYLNNISAIFKNYVLTPRTLYNQHTILSRYHYSILRNIYPEYKDNHNKTPINNLNNKLLNNIYAVPWHLSSSCVAQKYNNINYNINKTIDVFACITLKFGSYYRVHRDACLNELKKLSNNIICETRVLPHNKYIKALENSKICVSPYGLGEFAYRDYEAIYAGTLLIKPDMSYVETWPNIYKEWETYIPCKIDFSDLNDIIQDIISYPEKYEHIKINAINTIKNITKKDCLDKFSTTIKKVYENNY